MQSRREVQREQSRGSSMRIIRNLLIAILLILLIVWSVFAVSNQPRNSARRQTVSLAENMLIFGLLTNFIFIIGRILTIRLVARISKNNRSWLWFPNMVARLGF